MFYTETSPYFDPNKEVIKLTLTVNKEHYPNFPEVVYVSEFFFDSAIRSLMGLDIDIKRRFDIPDDEFYKTWIAFGVKAEHTKNNKFFGINGNTLYYRWI